jgi:hypothetical protein
MRCSLQGGLILQGRFYRRLKFQMRYSSELLRARFTIAGISPQLSAALIV